MIHFSYHIFLSFFVSFSLQILVHMAGIVFLTLILNATTIQLLLRALGMSEISDAKRTAMSNAINQLNDCRGRSISIMKTDRFMTDSDWLKVEAACIIHNPYDEFTNSVCALSYHINLDNLSSIIITIVTYNQMRYITINYLTHEKF